MRRSLSGDTVIALPTGQHLKYGSRDVGLQGEVMQAAGDMIPGIAPKVLAMGKRWHITKTQPAIGIGFDGKGVGPWHNASLLTNLVIERLGMLWNCPESWLFYSPPFTKAALVDYLRGRDALRLLYYSRENEMDFSRYDNANEATHGDCTFENTVFNSGPGVRHPITLIDWMPYRRPYLPAHRDVDYGKIIQGLLGWHETNFSRKPDRLALVQNLLEDRPMAGFWACIHYERIKARTTNKTILTFCNSNIEYLFHRQLKKERVLWK